MFGFLDVETEEKYKAFKASLIEKGSGKDFYIETEEVSCLVIIQYYNIRSR